MQKQFVRSQQGQRNNYMHKTDFYSGGNIQRPKTQGHGQTQRLGRKTFVHSDIAQYEQFMQNQQVKSIAVGDDHSSKSMLFGVNSNKNKQMYLSCETNPLMKQVSEKMKEIFSTKSTENTNFMNRRKNLSRSGNQDSGLYQLSFNPASRMIQQQRFRQ